MQNLSLSDTYEERLTNLNKKRKLQEANEGGSRIEIKKFTKKAEKLLNPTFINYASDYIEKFMTNSKEKWQVARGFVTNIIEVWLFLLFLIYIKNFTIFKLWPFFKNFQIHYLFQKKNRWITIFSQIWKWSSQARQRI